VSITVHRLQRVPSTQDAARRLVDSGEAAVGDVVVADEQTEGRGRFGRSWLSPAGGLYATFVLETGPLLSPLAGLGVVRALTRYGVEAELKWPNDVLIDGAKIAGILIETVRDLALVGIGLNVEEAPHPAATCLRSVGCGARRGELIVAIGEELAFLESEGAILDAYKAQLGTLGRTVRMSMEDGSAIEGLAVDVDRAGRLLVETSRGVHPIASGTFRHLRPAGDSPDPTRSGYAVDDDRKGEIVGLIDEAIALEERAETNYRSAAEMTSDPSAAKILGMLADEEARHADALRTMNAGSVQAEVSLIDAARDWVGGSIEGGVGAISSDAGLLDVLRRATDIERTTETFYREQGAASDDAQIRALFERLASIEKGHFQFVSSLVEYYERPEEWVESAEFGLRADY